MRADVMFCGKAFLAIKLHHLRLLASLFLHTTSGLSILTIHLSKAFWWGICALSDKIF